MIGFFQKTIKKLKALKKDIGSDEGGNDVDNAQKKKVKALEERLLYIKSFDLDKYLVSNCLKKFILISSVIKV